MTLNGVMAVILRYFSAFGYLPDVLRKSSRSLSHLLMSSCKYRLDKFRLDHPLMFDWKADLTGTGSRSFKCDIRVEWIRVV